MINIEIISKPRGAGKTHDLILKSAETDIPIITVYEPRDIISEANRLGVKIPNPINIEMYERYKEHNGLNSPYWKGEVLIDDVDEVLRKLLDADADTITLTSDSMDEFHDNEKTAEEIYEKAMKILNNYKNKHIDIYKEEKDMPTGTIYYADDLGRIHSVFGEYICNSNEITDVNIIVPNKVVEVTFVDGTKQKSVCQGPDTFSLETAISICISKKIMGGSGAYNNAIKRGMKVYGNKIKKFEEEKEEQERIAKKRAKREVYKARRVARKEQEEKERAIEIQKEAYIRALEEVEKRKAE